MNAASIFRNYLIEERFFVAPGMHDMMAAKLARQAGFEIGFASGFWLTASAYGLPDAGIATYTQMLDRVSTLVKASEGMAIIADADTGYGGLLNVHLFGRRISRNVGHTFSRGSNIAAGRAVIP